MFKQFQFFGGASLVFGVLVSIIGLGAPEVLDEAVTFSGGAFFGTGICLILLGHALRPYLDALDKKST